MRFASPLLVLALLAPVVPLASGEAPVNWALAHLSVPASGQGRVHFQTILGGSSDLILGNEFRVGGIVFGGVFFLPEDGGTHVDVMAPGVERSVTLAPGSSPGTLSWSYDFTFIDFTPGAPVAVLLYAPGGSMDAVQVEASDDAGPLAVEVLQGSGAATVRLDDAGAGLDVHDPGTAVIAAGGALVARQVHQGLVGSLALDCAVATCESFWVSPDARLGTLNQVATPGSDTFGGTGSFTFAGPAGLWAWGIAGAQRQPVFAAYAPVGDAWTLFHPGS